MKKNKQSLLWQISFHELLSPSYILGTMHIKPQTHQNWMQPFMDKIEITDSFATEFNLDDTNVALLQQYTQLPDGQTLLDFIPEKKIAKLEAIFLKAAGLPLRALLRSKPMVIVNFLAEKMMMEQQTVSMDSELYQYAKSIGKETTGIETFEEQLAILEKIPLEQQIQGLLKTGKNIRRFRKNLFKMTKVYEEGDVQKIHKIAKRGIGKMRRLMLNDRNEVMADRLFEKIQEKSIFCAIGAGHLGGKIGVLRLLKQKGVKLRAVSI